MARATQFGADLQVERGASAERSVVRVGFKVPPQTEEEVVSTFMKLFQETWELQNAA